MALNRSSLIRGETAPDAMLVPGDERDLEALLTNDAAAADRLGLARLSVVSGIEDLRVCFHAGSEASPGPGPGGLIQPRRR